MISKKQLFTLILCLPLSCIICFMIADFNPFGLDHVHQDRLAIPMGVALLLHVGYLSVLKEMGYLSLKAENIDKTFNALLYGHLITVFLTAIASFGVINPIIPIAILGVIMFIGIMEYLGRIISFLLSLIVFIALIKFIWRIV